MKKILWNVTSGIPENRCSLGIIEYHICKDGLYMSKKVLGSNIVTLKIDGDIKAPEGQNIIPKLKRKIPFNYYQKTIDFFKYVEERIGSQSEAFVVIGYNPDLDNFCMYVPRHSVTGGSVKYDLTDFWKLYKGYHIIIDIHSHSSKMSAFFSSTDNQDDNRDRFSGVIGYIDRLIPDYKFRFSSINQYFDCTIDELFCKDTDGAILDFDEAFKNINVPKPVEYIYNEHYSTVQKFSSNFNRKFSLRELLGKDW